MEPPAGWARLGGEGQFRAAPAPVRAHVHYVTTAHGGRGAVREVCELIMRAQGTFDARLESYFK